MNRLSRLIAAALPPALLLAGCASVPQDAGFTDVRAAVAERTGHRVRWNRLSPEDRAAESAVAVESVATSTRPNDMSSRSPLSPRMTTIPPKRS